MEILRLNWKILNSEPLSPLRRISWVSAWPLDGWRQGWLRNHWLPYGSPNETTNSTSNHAPGITWSQRMWNTEKRVREKPPGPGVGPSWPQLTPAVMNSSEPGQKERSQDREKHSRKVRKSIWTWRSYDVPKRLHQGRDFRAHTCSIRGQTPFTEAFQGRKQAKGEGRSTLRQLSDEAKREREVWGPRDKEETSWASPWPILTKAEQPVKSCHSTCTWPNQLKRLPRDSQSFKHSTP